MNEPDFLIEARRWLRYADEDLKAAQAIYEVNSATPRHSCWLAQQAAEKAIKAVLVFLQVDFPRTHDLDRLRNMIADSWRIHVDCPDLASLTQWAVEARYPGDWPEATVEDADGALIQAQRVLASVRGDFAAHKAAIT